MKKITPSVAAFFICVACIIYLLGATSHERESFHFVNALLGIACIFGMAQYRSISCSHLIFFAYYGLHYAVMPAIYGEDLAWNHFHNDLSDNWELLDEGLLAGFVGLACYLIGIFVCDYFLRRTKGTVERVTQADPSRVRVVRLAVIYGIIGFVGWAALVVLNDNPLDTMLGRPSSRRSTSGYLQILLFCSIHAFLLIEWLWYRRFVPRIGFYASFVGVLYLTLAKGARLDLLIIIISGLVLAQLISRDGSNRETVSALGRFLKANIGKAFVFVVATAASLFYTGYRSSLEGGSIDLPAFLHSLADSSAFLVSLDRFPRLYDFWNGMSYIHPFVIYIPSALFPRKYEFTYGITEFTELLFGYAVYKDAASTSHTYSILGEAYINAGWWGIIIQMFFVGMINHYLWIRAKTASLLGKIVYALYLSGTVPYAVKSGIVSGFEYLFQNTLLPLGLPLINDYRRRRRTS